MNAKWAFLCVIASFLICARLLEAQPPAKIPRIVLTRPERSGDADGQVNVDAFRQGLRELGYVEGKNFTLDVLWFEGQPERTYDRIVEALRDNVNFIVTSGTSSTQSARKATSTVPIIMANADDPVVTGLTPSLARPGGNITGITNISSGLAGKRLELLKEVLPKAARVVYLLDPTRSRDATVKQAEEAADALGMKLQSLVLQEPNDFENAFRSVMKGRPDGLIFTAGGVFNRHRTRLVELAIKHRLPSVHSEREWIRAGGLMVYGSSQPEQYRRAAIYVDKILKGAKPAELPVEQPTKFELLINLKTAKRIGLTIPPNILARADKVIR
jgi:putative tryptophan/tyrosine transport system substrate-binding protein